MNRDLLQKAIDDGIYEAAKDRAKNMASNEITQGGPTAEEEFERSMRELQDAHARMTVVVLKIFPIT